jgi:hypothetical protein
MINSAEVKEFFFESRVLPYFRYLNENTEYSLQQKKRRRRKTQQKIQTTFPEPKSGQESPPPHDIHQESQQKKRKRVSDTELLHVDHG